MRTESILTMKTASGNKQETVVLPTWRKNKLLIIRNSTNNRHVTFFPVQLPTTCPQTTHMLRWSKVNPFQKSAKED